MSSAGFEVVGLTGNIACGKSLVEGILAEAGVPVIDADVVAREVVQPGEPALEAIAERFPGVVGPDGLDRAALGAIVFGDGEARRALEAITHPAIFTRIAEKVSGYAAAGEPLVVVSAALMVESGSWRSYGALVVVTCPPDQQLARLLARDGFDEAQAQARIASQLPQAEKAALASVVIDNGGTPEETKRQVLQWLRARSGG